MLRTHYLAFRFVHPFAILSHIGVHQLALCRPSFKIRRLPIQLKTEVEHVSLFPSRKRYLNDARGHQTRVASTGRRKQRRRDQGFLLLGCQSIVVTCFRENESMSIFEKTSRDSSQSLVIPTRPRLRNTSFVYKTCAHFWCLRGLFTRATSDLPRDYPRYRTFTILHKSSIRPSISRRYCCFRQQMEQILTSASPSSFSILITFISLSGASNDTPISNSVSRCLAQLAKTGKYAKTKHQGAVCKLSQRLPWGPISKTKRFFDT